MYGQLQTVTPSSGPFPTAATRGGHPGLPGATVTAILTPSQPTRSTQFDLTSADAKELSVYVNPYNGEVLGHRDNAKDIVKTSKALHGSLMTASWLGDETYGDRFIEIVAAGQSFCWSRRLSVVAARPAARSARCSAAPLRPARQAPAVA